MEYRVTRVESSKDEQIFIDLINSTLYKDANGRGKVNWFYRNALIPGETFLLRTEDGTPIGTKGYAFHEFNANGEILIGALGVDICLDKNHRGLKQALFLNTRSMEMLEQRVDFHYTIPNKNSDALFRRRTSGFKKLGCFERYVKILDVKPALETKISNKAAVATLGTIINPLWGAINQLKRKSVINLNGQKYLDAGFINALQVGNDRDSFTFAGRKSYDYVDWRFGDNPFREYGALTYGGRGTIIFYVKEGRAHIADLILLRSNLEDDLPVMLLNFEKFCLEQSLSSIVMTFITNDRLSDLLKSLWYKKYSPGYNMWVSSDLELNSGTDLLLFTGDVDAE